MVPPAKPPPLLYRRQLAGETPYSASNSRELAGRRQFGSEKKFKLAQFSSKQKSLWTFCSQTQNKHFYQRDKKKGEFGTCCIVCHKLVVTKPAAPYSRSTILTTLLRIPYYNISADLVLCLRVLYCFIFSIFLFFIYMILCLIFNLPFMPSLSRLPLLRKTGKIITITITQQ
ncbi:hypothetical protein BJ165DRAFT_778809 [Panaeolus papilionaceus]|nr:hypothetical protein BJ165DRAFT_778809 [Panaeolus papilionaceus]